MSLTHISRDVATIVLSSAGQESGNPHSIRLSPRGGDNVVLKGKQIHPITLDNQSYSCHLPAESYQWEGGQGISGEPSAGRHLRHLQRRAIAVFLMDTHKKYMGSF